MNNEMTALHMDDSLVDESDVIQLVGMKLGEEEYAIDVLKIQEIIRTMEITIVPRSDSFILGVMNLRGRVIPVVDLRVRFNLEKMDFDQDTRIIVVRFEKEQIGFVVDEVTQVIRISQSMVEPTPPLVGAIGQEYILGICKYDDRLIILLDIDRVITKSVSTGTAESDLRKKLMGTDKKKPVAKKAAKASKAEKTPPPKAEAAPEVENTYSMADEADAMSKPLITSAESDDELHAILEDAVQQGNSVIQSSSENEIQQSDLDSLIAAELAKREAETDELNKKRKESTQDAPSSGEEALSIDDLIAMELAKREAETDELNKKRAEDGDKKKNELNDTETGVDSDEPDSEADEPIMSNDELREASLAELKEVARRIISGESDDLDLEVKGEFGELIRLLVDIKTRVDEISPTVISSQAELPNMSDTLNDVDMATERAAFNLLENAQKMSDFYNTLQSQITNLDKAVKAEDKKQFAEEAADISVQIDEAGDLGLHILEALEFQDITEQKLRKVLGSIEDVGARLGVIVGYIKSKDESGEDKGYDTVLTDLGFA